MNQHFIPNQLGLIRRHLIGERRRRSSGVRRILVAVPRACHTPINDSPFSKWTVLVPANIGNCRDLAVVAKDGHPLVASEIDLRALFRYVFHCAHFDETIPLSSRHSSIDGSLFGARQ